jgi:RES domain-containing protein
MPSGLVTDYIRSAATKDHCWRIIPPKWAHAPYSTAGAAFHGGRWNRVGAPALYLSEQFSTDDPLSTAWSEYQQDIGTRIGIPIPYDLNLTRLVDLTNAATVLALGLNTAEFGCAWKEIATGGGTPPTWVIIDRLLTENVQAIRVPSVAKTGGINIVVHEPMGGSGRAVQAFDPNNDLPVDQASWPPVSGP